MQWQQAVIFWLWRASIALQFVLCAKLALTGLWRSYRKFAAYLAALTAESCVLIAVTQNGHLYAKLWGITRVVVLALEIPAVLEIFDRWSLSYPGIGKFGQRLLLVLFVLAAGLSFATLPINWSLKGWVLADYLVMDTNRAVSVGLAAFLILMLVFFMKFGGPVAVNLKRHTWAMTVFTTANAIGYFLMTARSFWLANLLLSTISAGALVYWIFALNPSGEEPPATPPDDTDGWAEAEEMNRQLLEFAGSVRQSRSGGAKR